MGCNVASVTVAHSGLLKHLTPDLGSPALAVLVVLLEVELQFLLILSAVEPPKGQSCRLLYHIFSSAYHCHRQ